MARRNPSRSSGVIRRPWASSDGTAATTSSAWRYVVGFVRPAAGRTLFHLATSVSIPLCEVEAFARAVGAGVRLRVPEHLHPLFLPPYSPELQPAEHLWPLTNACLLNRYFATIEELEEVQLAHCAVLQAQPDRIRSTTRPRWWPQRVKKLQVPRRNRYDVLRVLS